MECIAAIDQGTQSTRVFIFDKAAQPLASHQEAFKQIYPQAGWVSCERRPARQRSGGGVQLVALCGALLLCLQHSRGLSARQLRLSTTPMCLPSSRADTRLLLLLL